MNKFFKLLKLVKGYWAHCLLNFLFNVLSILFSVGSLAMMVPFLNLLFAKEELVVRPLNWSLSVNSIVENINLFFSNLIITEGKGRALVYICIFVVIAVLFKNLFRYLASFFLAYVRSGVVYDVRKMLYDKILALPLGFFSNERKGDIMARLTSDVQEVEWSIMSSVEIMFRDPMSVIIYLSVMLVMSPKLTLFVFILLPVAGILIGSVGKSLKRTSDKGQKQMGHILSHTEETLSGLRTIKAFHAEKETSGKFDNINGRFRQLLTRMHRKRDLASPMSEFLGISSVIIVLFFGANLVLENKLEASVFMAYLGVFSQILPPAKAFTTGYYNIQKGLASVDRIQEILMAEININEKQDAKELPAFSKRIEYQNVVFRYDKSTVLDNVSFTIEKGQTIALVGPSGAGKTTIADLLPRFYDVNEGRILFDGVDIRDAKFSSLRKMMGVVSQDAILFNDTVASNILFGRKDISREQVIEAAKIANAHEFIIHLENGYDTNIGDSGNKLSGGQKQRLSIARAVLGNPEILILDEATSALDTESERLVQEALNRLMKNRTSLVIAHRLSTIQNADRIIVLNKGKIVQTGTHRELIDQDGLYKKLHQLQAFA